MAAPPSTMSMAGLSSSLPSTGLQPRKLSFIARRAAATTAAPRKLSFVRRAAAAAAAAAATEAENGEADQTIEPEGAAEAAEGAVEAAEEEAEEKPRVVYPKGLVRYETMVVLRPDITEDGRLALSQRYEEAIIAAGGMDVEIFNRGLIPLAYPIVKKNTRGEKKTHMDGIYYMLTYAARPASQAGLGRRFQMDDDVIRFMTFKLK